MLGAAHGTGWESYVACLCPAISWLAHPFRLQLKRCTGLTSAGVQYRALNFLPVHCICVVVPGFFILSMLDGPPSPLSLAN
jgi:hypothetical protein